MASRGDIKIENVQPKLLERWVKLGIEETIDKSGAFVKLKSKNYFENGKFPVVDQGDKFISGYVNDKSLLYQGELPVIIFGDHTRNVKYVDFPFAAGADGTKILKPKFFYNPKFYHYYFKSLSVPDLGYSRHFSILKEIEFPLPPLAEQNRIVAKLDTLFLQHEAIKKSMAKIPELLKNFRKQVLTQAVTGKLTEEWRKGKDLVNEYNDRITNEDKRKLNINLPDYWLDLSFDSVVTIKSNLVPPNDYLEYPLITPDVIQSGTGVLLLKPLVSDIMPISAKHYFSKGDIVYSKIRPYLSKLIITDFDGLCSADMYPISTDLDIKYLFYFMLSNEFLFYATSAGERSVLPKINQKGLNIIPIPTPSLREQHEIVSRVESLFAKADLIEQQYQSLKTKIDTLPQAILHKAFKGDLSEQLDTDGDATDLLNQIWELKSQTTKSKKK